VTLDFFFSHGIVISYMSFLRSSALSLAVALFFVVGCGDGEDSSSSASDSAPQTGQQAPPSGQQAPQGQSPPPGMQGPSGEAPSLDVSDEQMAAAGRVFVEIQNFQQEMQGSQEGQPSKQEQKEMMMEMQQLMKKAVQSEENLSLPMFQKIMMGARQDPELRKRLFSAIDQAGGSTPSPGPGSGQ
jgi:hypothetical protein